jgi:hypothetical protein
LTGEEVATPLLQSTIGNQQSAMETCFGCGYAELWNNPNADWFPHRIEAVKKSDWPSVAALYERRSH